MHRTAFAKLVGKTCNKIFKLKLKFGSPFNSESSGKYYSIKMEGQDNKNKENRTETLKENKTGTS